MINKLLKNKFFVLVFIFSILISIIAASHWFSGNKILYYWDSFVPFDPKISFNELFYFWQDRIFPGFAVPGWSWFLYWGLFFLPSFFGHSLSIGEFFVYVLLLSLSTINFYLLVKYILQICFKDKENSLLTKSITLMIALLYTFNIYTFFNFYFMFDPGAFMLAFLPLNILALIHLYPLDKVEVVKNHKKWLFIFFLSLICISPALSVYVFFLQYLIWTAVYLFIFWLVSDRNILSRTTLELITFYILIVFVNLWWFVPALLNFQNEYNGQSQFGTFAAFDQGLGSLRLLNSFRLISGGLMASNKFSWTSLYESNVFFTFPLFIFPLMLLISLTSFVKRKIPHILIFFLAMFVTSLFIVKLSNPPFAWILGFAFHYIPFFGAFRDSDQKAGIFYTFPYFIFVAVGISFAAQWFLEKKAKAMLLLLVISFIIGAVILSGPFFLFITNNIYSLPFSLNGKNYVIRAKTQVPPEYLSLKKFLENKCPGETIMEVPRSGFITNAIWQKYNLSYDGQDMLPALIPCSFLSTATFNGEAEAAIEAPYLFLQEGDFQSFKNYLIQNNIKYVLVRHDFVPQPLLTWTYVDPNKAERFLLSDREFSEVYSNDLVTLFDDKAVRGKQYGFGVTANVVNVPSGIKDSIDYTVVSKLVGNVFQPVILDSGNSQKLFESRANMQAISANCIECVKINPNSMMTALPSGFLANAKNFIKSIIKNFVHSVYPPDAKIDLDILSANNYFKELIKAIDSENMSNTNHFAGEYQDIWRKIDREISTYKADKFSVNNKHIEATNFLTIQENTILNYFSPNVFNSNKFLSKDNGLLTLERIMSFQRSLDNKLSKNIQETNLDKNKYVFRLDIPQSENYICQTTQADNGATVNSLQIGNLNLNPRQINGFSPVYLKRGSYFMDLGYQTHKIYSKNMIRLPTGIFSSINIGRLEKGTYKISFRLPQDLNVNGKVFIVVGRQGIPSDVLEKLSWSNNSRNDVKIIDTISTSIDKAKDYKQTFSINEEDTGEYSLYLYFVDTNLSVVNVQNLNDKNLSAIKIQNLNVETSVSGDYFRFYCKSGEAVNSTEAAGSLLVKKINPTKYEVLLPENYSGFLTFNQAYDKNWEAYAEGSILPFTHFKSGYENAWYINKSIGRKIIIEYKTQGIIEESAIISVIVFVVAVLFYLGINKKNEKN